MTVFCVNGNIDIGVTLRRVTETRDDGFSVVSPTALPPIAMV